MFDRKALAVILRYMYSMKKWHEWTPRSKPVLLVRKFSDHHWIFQILSELFFFVIFLDGVCSFSKVALHLSGLTDIISQLLNEAYKFSELVLPRMALLTDQSRLVLPLRSVKAREFGELWREKCTRAHFKKLTRTSSFRPPERINGKRPKYFKLLLKLICYEDAGNPKVLFPGQPGALLMLSLLWKARRSRPGEVSATPRACFAG